MKSKDDNEVDWGKAYEQRQKEYLDNIYRNLKEKEGVGNMKLTYKPSGVCCKQIDIEVEGNILVSVNFTGGCPGGLAAIKRVVEGMAIEKILEMFDNVTCGNKNTSCVMQLCKALRMVQE